MTTSLAVLRALLIDAPAGRHVAQMRRHEASLMPSHSADILARARRYLDRRPALPASA